MAQIDWKGGQVARRMTQAAAAGVDKTMSECVTDARSGHEQYPPASAPGQRYADRTGFALASTDISKHATPEGTRIAGAWGSSAEYALYLEIGTSREDSGFPRAQVREAEGAGDMDQIPPPSDPPLMAPRPTLRPAADAQYPKLRAWIAAAFQGRAL